MLKSYVERTFKPSIQVWGVNLAYNVDFCVSRATATLSAGFQATWKHILHGCVLRTSPVWVWNNYFPGGINQGALTMDRVQRMDLMTADHLSKE